MKNVLDVKVSCFKNVFSSTDPKEVNLITWLKSKKYFHKVEAIRKETDKNKIKHLKEELPVITPSGLFSKGKNEALVKHSNLLCIDIDFKDNTKIKNYQELKNQLSNIKNIAYCGLSVSGNGYFCLIPIAYPEKHKEHYELLKELFETIGIIIDKQCSNLSRYRFYSYDPDAYYNYSAIPFSQIKRAQLQELIEVRSQGRTMNNSNHGELLINEIFKRKIDITTGYREWFEIGCALANEYGEAGREYFHSISQFNISYHFKQTDKQFNECLRHKYSYDINTLFYYCKLHNIYLKDILHNNEGDCRERKPIEQQQVNPKEHWCNEINSFIDQKETDLEKIQKIIQEETEAPF